MARRRARRCWQRPWHSSGRGRAAGAWRAAYLGDLLREACHLAGDVVDLRLERAELEGDEGGLLALLERVDHLQEARKAEAESKHEAPRGQIATRIREHQREKEYSEEYKGWCVCACTCAVSALLR